MLKFLAQNKKKLICALAVLLFLFCGQQFFNNYREINNLQQDVQNLEQVIEQNRVINQDLEKELELVNNDDYIEQIAREKLGLVKPGETLLIPVEAEKE